MRTYRGKKRVNRVKFLLVAIVLVSFFTYVQASINTLVRDLSFKQANLIGTEIINKAVNKVLTDSKTDYDKLVEVKNANSENMDSVRAVTVNSMEVNRLRAQVSEEITEELKQLETTQIAVPVGSLLKSDLFTARGPEIKLKIKPNGFLTTKIISEFDDAGINQTRHRIVINIAVDISCTMPLHKNMAKVSSELVVAETVIVGIVPEYYTKVVSEDEQLISKLNDYSSEKKL